MADPPNIVGHLIVGKHFLGEFDFREIRGFFWLETAHFPEAISFAFLTQPTANCGAVFAVVGVVKTKKRGAALKPRPASKLRTAKFYS
jgi:hypothetical protein